MNVWTDIAIGNLQRHRGPPLDMDIETGSVVAPKLYKCKKCGESKRGDEFYMKHDNRTDTWRQQTTCKVCICKRDVARRPKKPRKPRPYEAMLGLMATTPRTLREMYEALGLSRRVAQRMIYKLIDDGLVIKMGKSGINRDPQNPPIYGLTTKGATGAGKEQEATP